MVLQRNQPIHIQGTVEGKTNQQSMQLTARLSSGSKQYESSTTVSVGKQFEISIPTAPAQTNAYTLTFLIGEQVIHAIHNVYIGDVFLAAGQSNMELNEADYYGTTASFTNNAQGLFTASDLPTLINDTNVHFLIANHDSAGSELPISELNKNGWLPATSDNAQHLGYLPQLFAERLRQKSPDVPIGIIQVAWGGTNIYQHLKGSSIYNNHIAPLKGYHIAGILWYQGENDAAELASALQYESQFTALINQYRDVFTQSDLPFLYVQIARYTNYQYMPIVRQAQYNALYSIALGTTKNLAMTISIDTDKGTAALIHPLGKEILAERMANQWLAMTNDKTPPSGPMAKSASIVSGDTSTVTIDFNSGTADGLQARQPNYALNVTSANLSTTTTEPLEGFEVAGSDGVFYPANATIQNEDNTVTVHSDAVAKMTQVRYLWDGAPASRSMLYNGDNLPASPFLLAAHGTSITYPFG